jgi:ankyrin repeat protein
MACGCEAASHNGRTIAGTFPDPEVAALVRAAETDDVGKMRGLVHEGADINYAGTDGITPLVWVMADHDDATVEALLQLGADPNKKIGNGNSPMWLAAGRNDPKMLELMLKYHGDPNIIGAGQITALEIAVRQFDVRNINMLVKHGADINYANSVGQSAATWAVALGQFDIVAHLLDLGYSHNLQDLAGWVQASKVDATEQPEKNRVIQMLRARGVQYPVPKRHPPKP